jgi:hypothetical protein
MQTTPMPSTLTDEQAAQMAGYVEDLLSRQIERLKKYDLDGAMRLAEEAQPLADRLSRGRELSRAALTAQRDRIQGLYKELCLVIASQRQEVSDKLNQIRTGLKTLGTYSRR